MEIAQHISVIEEEAELFAEAAERGGFSVGIATCPGWDMRSLVRHLSEIHLWAAAHVACRATKLSVDDLQELAVAWPDLAVFWPDDGDLLAFYLATNANLVRELEAAPADVAAMTFLPAPSPLAMWARRQAHELTIHRIDAQRSAGPVSEIGPDIASDGIDELLMAFAPRSSTFPVEEERSMAIHAVDTDDRWRVLMGPDGVDSAREGGAADVALSGRAADLYLALWNRGDGAGLDVRGDRDVLASWHNNHRIRWS